MISSAHNSTVSNANSEKSWHLLLKEWQWLTLRERQEAWKEELGGPIDYERLAYWRRRGNLEDDNIFAHRLDAEGFTYETFASVIASNPPSGTRSYPIPDEARLHWEIAKQIVGNIADGEGFPQVTDELLIRLRSEVPDLPFLHPYLAWAAVELDGLPIRQTVLDDILAYLCGRLSSIATRTLVLLMRVAQLTGGPGADAANLNEYVSRSSIHEEVLQRYPGLVRRLVRATLSTVGNNASLIRRIEADRGLLVAEGLLRSLRAPLRKLQLGLSDPHRGENSVALVCFEDGSEFLYKPRAVDIEREFQMIIRFLGSMGLDLPLNAKIVAGDGYGYMSLVRNNHCAEADVPLYYRRQGMYLAIMQALGAIDLHSENVIADGPTPVWIDLECLLHRYLAPTDGTLNQIRQAFRESVISNGMLPFYGDDSIDAVEIGGLGGRPGQHYPAPGPGWTDSDTRNMRLTMRRTAMPVGMNVPIVDGERREVDAFVDELVDGYSQALDVLQLARTHWSFRAALRDLAHCEARMIVRPTSQYLGLLWDSSHPDFLRSAVDAELPFERVWREGELEPWRWDLLTHELHQLRRGDVPVFVHTPIGNEVRDPRGRCVATIPGRSGYMTCVERLSNLSDPQKRRDLRIVRGAISAAKYSGEPVFRVSRKGPIDAVGATDEQLLAAAQAEAELLLETSLGEGKALTWCCPYPLNDTVWRYGGIGIDLYSGNLGPAIYLAALASIDENDRWRTAAKRAVAYIEAVLDEEMERLPLGGAFTGLSSVARGLALLDRLLPTERLGSVVQRVVKGIERRGDEVRHVTEIDLLDGLSGLVVALDQIDDPSADAVLHSALDPLIYATEQWLMKPGGLCGAAHGAAGIALANEALANRCKSSRAASTADTVRQWENIHILSATSNWADLRAEGRVNDDDHLVAWCHGAAGIGLARLGEVARGRRDAAADVAMAVRGVVIAGLRPTDTVCHGTFGNIELLLAVSGPYSANCTYGLIRKWATVALAERKERMGWALGVPEDMAAPGLMTGVSGIGLQLLRIIDQSIPSILLI